jgi:hypothetical protein
LQAFGLLKFENQPFVAQVLSKIFRLEKKFENAEAWAKTAIQTNAVNSQYPFFDTLGQVYKAQLLCVKSGQGVT